MSVNVSSVASSLHHQLLIVKTASFRWTPEGCNAHYGGGSLEIVAISLNSRFTRERHPKSLSRHSRRTS